MSRPTAKSLRICMALYGCMDLGKVVPTCEMCVGLVSPNQNWFD
jgi:hypothetical protein